jgi:hypothetical protein
MENDIRQIRQVIREEIKPLEERMTKIEDRMTNIETRVTKIEVRMEDKFNSVEDKISLLQWFIGVLVAIVVAAIAIPQLLILYREKKEAKEIDKLREAIVELKGKKVITQGSRNGQCAPHSETRFLGENGFLAKKSLITCQSRSGFHKGSIISDVSFIQNGAGAWV